MIVIIDVSLSHLFFSSSSTFFLFRRLGVNFLSHAHPLRECSKCRKVVDQFDLYLASGLGTSPYKISKDTKCETLVDLVLKNKKFSLSYSQSPFLHANTIWRHSSHGQRELLHILFYVSCFNANIDSCLLRLELNCMLSLLYLKVLIWLCGMSP